MTPDEKHTAQSLGGRIGAHRLWAAVEDRTAATAPGRTAFMSRFEREVDPDGVLPTHVRAQRAENARKAYFAGLSLLAAKARARNRLGRAS